MSVRVGINGFGWMGRLAWHPARSNPDALVVDRAQGDIHARYDSEWPVGLSRCVDSVVR